MILKLMNKIKSIDIEPIGIDQLHELQAISRQTFVDTFAKDNTEENMQLYLEEGLSLTKLSEELHEPNTSFYFARLDQLVVGYLKLNFGNSQTELSVEQAIEIERIYVLNAHQGKGIGQRLFEKVIEMAKAKNATYIWLGVWEKNHRAMGFYQKNGFVAFDKHIFRLGHDEQTDVLMKRML